MYLRATALKWLKSKYGLDPHAVYTSKYYQSFESWPKKEVWWLQIPLTAIDQYRYIHLLCQTAPDSSNFQYLNVPSSFFKENLRNFDIVQDKINIYLSPHPADFLMELRGKGSLKFKSFLVSNQ